MVRRQPNHEVPFRLASLSATGAPEGSDGTWYRYVIVQGTNRITGVRNGAEDEVMHLVQDMVERMNERRIGKNRPRSQKPVPQASAAK